MNDITALAQRMNEVDPRDEFEKLFPLPVFCIRCGTGYASTSFNGWAANTHKDRWEGWKAAMALMESRTVTVKLPTGYVVRPGHPINEGERGVMIPKDGGAWLSHFDVEHMLKVAGIQVIEGEQKNG